MTGPVSALSCSLYVDGARVASGLPGDNVLAPTALSGLSLAWGRGTTIDQPEPATLSATLWDIPGGQTFLELIRVGSRVDVRAAGTLYPDTPSVSAVVDGAFLAEPVGSRARLDLASNQRQGSARDDPTGLGYVRVISIDVAASATPVGISPDVFPPGGALPGAWDALPTTSPGQQWKIEADVWAPQYVRVELIPVFYTAPRRNVQTPGRFTATHYAPPGWSHQVGTIAVPPAGRWVGLGVITTPLPGYRWADSHPVASWSSLPDTGWPDSWAARGVVLVDNLAVWAPAAGTVREVLVFSGRVTDLVTGYDFDRGATTVEVTAVDFLTDLAGRPVVPTNNYLWVMETLAARVARILAGAGSTIPTIIDPSAAANVISRMMPSINDRATPMLNDLADSADSVLWAATHITTGPYLRIEDPANRISLLELVVGPGGLIEIAPATFDPMVSSRLSSCYLLLDPVQWRQDKADVNTRVQVDWRDQASTVSPNEPETASVELIDRALEADLGVQALSLSSLLTSAPAADRIARQILTRTGPESWRVAGLVWETGLDDEHAPMDSASVGTALDLLDGTTRIGRPFIVTGLPEWTPISGDLSLYVEGGIYSYIDGAWELSLLCSAITALGRSARWYEIDPIWRWIDFDPAISWADLIGVGP